MAAEAGSGALGAYGWVVVAAGVAAAGVGGLYYAGLIGSRSEVETATTEQKVVAEPSAVDVEREQPKTVGPVVDEDLAIDEPDPEVKDTVEIAALLAPSLDQIRIESDGQALLAGRAAAGSTLSVLLDGTEVASATIDASGQFAQFLTIPFSDGQRALTLRSEKDGAVVLSDDYFIAALPRQVAEQDPAQAEVALAEQPIADEQTTQDDTVVVAQAETALAIEEAPVTEQGNTVSGEGEGEAPEVSEATQPAKEAVAVETPTAQAVVDQVPEDAGSETPVQDAQTTAQVEDTPTPESTATPVQDAHTTAQIEVIPTPESTATASSSPQQVSKTVSEETVAQLTQEVVVAEISSNTKSVTSDPVRPNDDTTPSQAEDAPLQVGVAKDHAVETDVAKAPEPEAEPAEVVEASAPEVVEPEPAQTPPAILQSNAEGVKLVQAPSPEPEPSLAQLVLDTIGYSELGDVQLTGRAKIGSVIRIYLDNNSVSDLLADGEGHWRGELLGIDPGIYTLRLDELDTEGVVLSRLETPFKREAPEVLKPVVVASGPDQVQAPAIRAVTVQKGDTLWAISRQRYGDGVLYVKVFEANRSSIRDPHLIYPGQIFTIPE
ncbi:LysM peptidoglycan-binding domain-containing protein [Phaeobacter sp. NW0010-22]|uniref:LysM peptidoglycan-binding domain-containing protein n=1 Tax=Phaeobacter sp. NW0010-22 TaxID=3135907 RepID=UPI00310680EB